MPLVLTLFSLLALLVCCSSEDRQAITDKEAQKQVDRIKQPIDKAKEAAKLIEKHNNQQQQNFPD